MDWGRHITQVEEPVSHFGTCQWDWDLVSGIETCQQDCDCESQSQLFLAHATLSFPHEISQVAEGRREIHCPSFSHLSPSRLGLVNLNPCHLLTLAHSPFFAHTPRSLLPMLPFRTSAVDHGWQAWASAGIHIHLHACYLWLPVHSSTCISLFASDCSQIDFEAWPSPVVDSSHSKHFPSQHHHSKLHSISPSILLLAYTLRVCISLWVFQLSFPEQSCVSKCSSFDDCLLTFSHRAHMVCALGTWTMRTSSLWPAPSPSTLAPWHISPLLLAGICVFGDHHGLGLPSGYPWWTHTCDTGTHGFTLKKDMQNIFY